VVGGPGSLTGGVLVGCTGSMGPSVGRERSTGGGVVGRDVGCGRFGANAMDEAGGAACVGSYWMRVSVPMTFDGVVGPPVLGSGAPGVEAGVEVSPAAATAGSA
jgi:hypothetical protein